MELNSHLTSLDRALNFPIMASTACKSKGVDDFIPKTNVAGDLESNNFDEYSNSEVSHEFLPKAHLRRSHSLGSLEDAERTSSGGDVTEENVIWDCKCAPHDLKKINDGNFAGFAEELEVSEMKFLRLHGNTAEEPLNQFSDSDHQGSLADDANVQSSGDACSFDISLNICQSLSRSQSLSSLQVSDIESAGFTKSRSFGDLSSMINKKVSSVDCLETVNSRLNLNMKEPEKQGSACHQDFDEYYPISDSTCGSNEFLHQKKDTEYFDEHDNDNRLAKTDDSLSNADSVKNCRLSYKVVESNDVPDQERGKQICYEISKEDQSDYGSDMQRCDDESLTWMGPETDSANLMKKLPDDDSYVEDVGELTNKEFNIRRIRDWINQIDVQDENIVEEVGEVSKFDRSKHPNKSIVTSNKKLDAKSSLGMEVAYTYISTLSPVSSSARLTNMGLVAILSLSAFVGLKTLNLSGNSIVRITAGCLPKGLHILNLSKNNIPGIEGLRELTRLRILDLSYNRISKIGHGLSACSSLRELYLAGNKISEVEGLHRLLKLNILDLSSNKIATSKGFGQLAANYASLQVISLEGNPAQKNTGDEQLKKFLLSILPYLISYNKKVIRASGSKEVSVARPSRPLSSHQSDRSLRSEHKRPHRASISSHKSASSHVQSANVLSSLLKTSKVKHGRSLPPAASKQTDRVPKSGLKIPSFHSSSLMRRIRSEGTILETL